MEVEKEGTDEQEKSREEKSDEAAEEVRKMRAKPLEGVLNPEMIAPEPKTVRTARGLISSYAIKGFTLSLHLVLNVLWF